MKTLLTGCLGQVGCEIERQCSSYGFEIKSTHKNNLDIALPDQVRKIIEEENIDIVINAAAYTAVDNAENDEEKAHEVNAIGSEVLARVTADHNIPLLHISTDYVFDGNSTFPYTELMETNPQGAYGRTKLAGERLVSSINPKHLILRTSWVFGSTGSNFVKTMLRIGSEREEVSVVSDQLGSPTFAGHIASALLQVSQQYSEEKPVRWGTYHFTDAGITTWHMFATKIMQLGFDAGLLATLPKVLPILSENYPTPAKRPHYSGLDCSRFISSFPQISIQPWEKGLLEVISSLKNNV